MGGRVAGIRYCDPGPRSQVPGPKTDVRGSGTSLDYELRSRLRSRLRLRITITSTNPQPSILNEGERASRSGSTGTIERRARGRCRERERAAGKPSPQGLWSPRHHSIAVGGCALDWRGTRLWIARSAVECAGSTALWIDAERLCILLLLQIN